MSTKSPIWEFADELVASKPRIILSIVIFWIVVLSIVILANLSDWVAKKIIDYTITILWIPLALVILSTAVVAINRTNILLEEKKNDK